MSKSRYPQGRGPITGTTSVTGQGGAELEPVANGLTGQKPFGQIIGRSQAIGSQIEKIQPYARSDSPVLIFWESRPWRYRREWMRPPPCSSHTRTLEVSRVSRSKNLIHPLRQVAGRLGVGCLAGGLLGDRPALVAGAVQGVHHCRPVRFAIEQFRALATGT